MLQGSVTACLETKCHRVLEDETLWWILGVLVVAGLLKIILETFEKERE